MANHNQGEPPTSDPHEIPETLCIGRFNLAPGPGPLATLTITNLRSKASLESRAGQK